MCRLLYLRCLKDFHKKLSIMRSMSCYQRIASVTMFQMLCNITRLVFLYLHRVLSICLSSTIKATILYPTLIRLNITTNHATPTDPSPSFIINISNCVDNILEALPERRRHNSQSFTKRRQNAFQKHPGTSDSDDPNCYCRFPHIWHLPVWMCRCSSYMLSRSWLHI